MTDHIIRVSDPCKPLEFDLSRPLEIEVGCGKGKFLAARAAANPDCDFLGIERMLERVRLFDGKCRRGKIDNAKVLRLEALYTFHYLLPEHHARTVYVFFPDPWPKKKHHSHRLFGPLFRTALWKRLEVGGKLEFATDHQEYFEEVCAGFSEDARYERVEPMPRPQEVWTEFETMFREQGLPIYSAAWKSLPGDDAPLAPLTVPPEAEPREGIFRRVARVSLAAALLALSLHASAAERRIALAEYRDRMEAAWIGQMAGVSVGQPIEFKYNGPLAPREAVLRKKGDEARLWWPEMVNEAFGQDDLYVEMTFLRTLSVFGLDVRPARCGIDFANSQYRLWYANDAGRKNLRKGIAPPDSGHPAFSKECNEIDYQIEADFSGLVSPGCPNAVIAFGEKFGRLMNYGEGVWGGDFVGGMYAEAFFTTNREQIVRAGLRCIPKESSYRKAVAHTLELWQKGAGWEKAHEDIQVMAHQGWMPQIKDVLDCRLNGVCVVIGILWGEGDPEKTIEIAARCGYDADCNPSSAAGVVFATIGKAKLDPKWYSALDRTRRFSYTEYSFDALIATCEELAKQVVVAQGGRLEGDVLVIPVKDPVPPPFVPSWKPEPPAGAKYNAYDMKSIVFDPDGKRKAK